MNVSDNIQVTKHKKTKSTGIHTQLETLSSRLLQVSYKIYLIGYLQST